MPDLCNINGEITPESEAKIPVLDRGFLFGDSIYEVMRTRSGVPFAWREHLERLRASADAINLELDLDDRGLMSRVRDTLDRAGSGEKYVRIIITRGTGTAPNIDLAFASSRPNVILMVRDLPPKAYSVGKVWIVPRLRTDRRALDPAIKSGNYLNNLLGLAEARERGATDCLFLNTEGLVTEASTANVFVVRDGALLTPPLSAGLLAGITRRLVFECAAEARFEVRETALSADDVRTADEVFLSSTQRDIMPVSHCDGEPIADGNPGPHTTRLAEAFAAFLERKTQTVDAPTLAKLLG